MKKHLCNMALLLLMAGGWSSCTSTEEEIGGLKLLDNGVNVRVERGLAETRTVFDFTETALTIGWAAGDKLGIYDGEGGLAALTCVTPDEEDTRFSSSDWKKEEGMSYSAFYPYDNQATHLSSITLDFTGQAQSGNDDTSHLAEKYFMASGAVKAGNESLNITLTPLVVPVTLRFTFTKDMKLVGKELTKLTLKHSGEGDGFITEQSLDISGSTPVLSNPVYSESITLELSNVTATADTKGIFYLMMPLQSLKSADFGKLEVWFTDAEGAEYEVPLTGKDLSNTSKAGYRMVDNIDFADPLVKEICVANYDKDGDGEISYEEAAQVTRLTWIGAKRDFRGTEITTFNELRYFINLKSIELQQFRSCKMLTEITLPEGITSIKSLAFSDCYKLEYINIPQGVTSIEASTFDGCGSLNISIPDGVTSIGGYAFRGCSSLTSINIPESVTSIEYGAFAKCSGLTTLMIPATVTSIGSGVFHDCTSLKEITVQEGITSLSGLIFAGCSSLEQVVLPNSLTTIGSCAFQNCSNLASIEIPSGVTSIEDSAFDGCSSLTTVNIPDGVTSITHWMFRDCINLTNVIIPSGVTSIEGEAFQKCQSLMKIEIPESVTSIGGGAFRSSGLETVNIPSGVTSIEDHMFYICKSLEKVVFPAGITSIGEYAIYSCNNLIEIKCYAANPPAISKNSLNLEKNCKILVPSESVEAYREAWSTYADRIQAIED